MLTIQRIHNYAPSHLDDALTFLQQYHREFPFAALVSKSFGLSEANAALKFAAESGAMRVAVAPTEIFERAAIVAAAEPVRQGSEFRISQAPHELVEQ